MIAKSVSINKWWLTSFLLGFCVNAFSAANTLTNPTVTPSSPILVQDAGQQAGSQTVTTNRQCPSGYTPYIWSTVYEVDDSHSQPGAWGALVTSIVYNGTTNYSGNMNIYKEGYQGGSWSTDTHVRWMLFCFPPGYSAPAFDG